MVFLFSSPSADGVGICSVTRDESTEAPLVLDVGTDYLEGVSKALGDNTLWSVLEIAPLTGFHPLFLGYYMLLVRAPTFRSFR